MSESSYLVFVVRGRRRLIRVEDVREIVPLVELELVDGGSGTFRGMMNLRGDVVPVFDLASVDAPLRPTRLILLVERQDSFVGLIVDEVNEVLSIPDSSLAERPIGEGITVAAARVEGELLTMLDPKRATLGVANRAA